MISKKPSKESNIINAIVICGPTASGKSDLGMTLARRFNGSIVSADSRQIYRRLDIGTAKPTRQEMAEIPHYLVDVVDVTDDFTAADFGLMASESIEQIQKTGRIPIIVGGAGLYIEALIFGLAESPARDDNFRIELKDRIKRLGSEELHKELERLDPESAQKISSNDPVRIIRALEIIELSGRPASLIRKGGKPKLDNLNYLIIGLDYPRKELYERIDYRVDLMIEQGLVEEVKSLVGDGLGDALKNKKIVGYSEIIDALEGTINLNQAIELVKQHSRNYAKRQMTWFRNRTKPLWFNPLRSDFGHKVIELIDDNLSKV